MDPAQRPEGGMDPYIVVLTGFGFVVLLTAWLPMVLKEIPLSLPMACIAIGAGLGLIPGVPGIAPHPMQSLAITERVTEVVVLVALMGAGLKLDRPLRWRSGYVTWRLLALAMPLTIAGVFVAGFLLLGVGAASALLLAAALAPTDPVLASDVQVGAPGKGKEDEVRYALTSEAGLNDGLAFPFVHLAIALAALERGWFAEWVLVDVVWKIGCGLAVGWVVGRILGWATFRLPNRSQLSRTGDGLVAIGITAIAYGAAEMLHGYGFLAVFVAALSFRSVERNHRYHDLLHGFVEQLERLLMSVILVLMGYAVTGGGLLAALEWQGVAVAALLIFAIRPLAGWASLIGCRLAADERAVIAFFGIRGIGSVYYLAYAFGAGAFDGADALWSTAAIVILASVVLHGTTVTPVMKRLDRNASRRNGGEAAAGMG
jgi:NhaP-type Na+/H+ or K+/H+ antiporter